MKMKTLMVTVGTLAIFVLIQSNVFAQALQKTYYSNGELKSETDFDQGFHKEYYENGQIRLITNYEDDRMTSQRAYYESGKIQAESKNINCLVEGVMGQVFFENGKLKSESICSNPTAREIIMKTFHKNGNVKEENIFIGGQVQTTKSFTKRGKLITRK